SAGVAVDSLSTDRRLTRNSLSSWVKLTQTIKPSHGLGPAVPPNGLPPGVCTSGPRRRTVIAVRDNADRAEDANRPVRALDAPCAPGRPHVARPRSRRSAGRRGGV